MGSAESKKKFNAEVQEEPKIKTIDRCRFYIYRGGVKYNIMHGKGEYTYLSDSCVGKYTVYGEWDNNKLISGKIVYTNDDTYEGEILEIKRRDYTGSGYTYFEYKPNGQGKLYNSNGTLLEGTFKEGKFTGFGRKITDRECYEGDWKDGYYHGNGKLYNTDGTYLLEGKFHNGKFTGKGRRTNRDDSAYEGDWKNGLYHGKGKLIKKEINEETKVGEFVELDGYFHKGGFVGETITDEVRKLFFPELTEETNQETNQEINQTNKVQPDAPEAEQEEGEYKEREVQEEQEGEPEPEPKEVGESDESEVEEEEPKEVGESDESEVEEQEPKQQNKTLVY